MIKFEIEKKISEALTSLGIESRGFVVEYPADMKMGDYSTNVAIKHGQKEALFQYLNANKPEGVEKVELAGPGFINFHLSKLYFGNILKEVLERKDDFGRNNSLNLQRTIIEYTVCNVLKPMHIGHLMGNVIGESLSRILEWNGAEVKRNNYQGDSGLHVAKAVWGILKKGGKIGGALSEQAKYIGEAYAMGNEAYESEPAATEIKEFNKKLFEKSDSELNVIYDWGRKISLDNFEVLYKKLGTKFDFYFFESEVAETALRIVKEYIAKGVFEESDGAIVFKGEARDPKLHTRVFINNLGLPMYEAKDIAHAIRKEAVYVSDRSIILTANEQNEYFKVVLKALDEVNHDIAKKTEHMSHGLLKLSSGKMSSRKGNVITGEDLLRGVEEMVMEKIKDREFTEEEKCSIASQVAVGAIKYSILRQAVGGDILFDFEKSISFEGDSGPYLQYSLVRATSVINKAKDVVKVDAELPTSWETSKLEKLLERFPSVISRSGVENSPHFLVTHLTELASEFNAFYAHHKIVDGEDASSGYKLSIVEAFATAMKNGLTILGIPTPERM